MVTSEGANQARVDAATDATEQHEEQAVHRGGLPKRFVRNVAWNYTAAIVTGVSALVVTPILLRELGDAAYGVFILATSLTGYLELLEFGFAQSTTKLVADDAGKDSREVSRTLSTSLLVLSGFGAIALLVGVGLAFAMPVLFDIKGDLHDEAVITALVLSVTMALSLPGDTLSGTLAGYQRYDLRGLTLVTNTALTAVASVVIVLLGGDIVHVAIASATLSIAMHPIRWFMIRHIDHDVRVRPSLVERSRLKRVASMSGWMFVAQFALVVSFRLDTVVTGAVIGVQAVALFTVGSKLARLAERILSQMSSVFMPHAASLASDGQTEQVKQVLIDGTRTTLMAAVPFALTMGFLAPQAVEVWVGDGYGEAATVLTLLSAYTLFRGLGDTAEMVLMGTGRMRTWSLALVAEGLTNLVASIVLANLIGVEGVALGTLVAGAVVLLPILMPATLREVDLDAARWLREGVRPHLLPFAATSTVLLAARLVIPASLAFLVIAVAAALLTYFAIYFTTGATPFERQQLTRLTGRLRRRAPAPSGAAE